MVELSEIIDQGAGLVHLDWCVGVQFGDAWGGNLCTWLSNVIFTKKELRGQILDLCRVGIVKGNGFDTGKGNVFCCDGDERKRLEEWWQPAKGQQELRHTNFGAQTFGTTDEDV